MFADFEIIKKCKTTNARVSKFHLSNIVNLPVYMPVATYGAMRSVPFDKLEEELILSNTYHLRKFEHNIKSFMGWNKSLLTDSGGFQIQSLPDVEVVDDGVKFNGKLFKPEDSIKAQLKLKSDIMMQLDDVVNPLMEYKLHEKAVSRSLEWLDRSIIEVNKTISNENDSDEIESHKKPKLEENTLEIKFKDQLIFPIIQGGLLPELRMRSIEGILKRKPKGLAIGGLSGGEDKLDFAKTVLFCIKNLPENIPKYLMGVGYPEDIVVCYALGADMSDCVYPTRTARFGRAFRDSGDILLGNKYLDSEDVLGECSCTACKYTIGYLSHLKGTPNFCMLISEHNLSYMRNLCRRIRNAILEDRFPEFIKEYLSQRYKNKIPAWIVTILKEVNVNLENQCE